MEEELSLKSQRLDILIIELLRQLPVGAGRETACPGVYDLAVGALLDRLVEEDRLRELAPEERLRGLDPEIIEAWLRQHPRHDR